MPKAAKVSNTSKGSRSIIKSNPFTPVRRLLFKLDRFRPGNRHRSQYVQYQELTRHGRPEPDPVVDTPPEQPPAPAPSSHTHACMALQNDDLTEDAVVITALSTLPFCCHEDLLTMPRHALVAVADSLNAKLPGVLQISVSLTRTDAAIRNEIEFIVGLRTEMPVPPAPRAQRPDGGYVPEVDADEEMDKTPPTSPLSRRGRRMFQIYGTPGTPRLERLVEAEEENDEEYRPMKRQKTWSSTVKEADDSMDVDVDVDVDVNVDEGGTPTPVTTRPCARIMRSHSEHVPASPSPTPRPRVLRSHSTKLPAKMADIKVDTAFINTKQRLNYRKRENIEVSGRRRVTQPALIHKTSTPKQKARAASTAAACRPFLALPQESTSMSSLTSQESVEMSPASSDSYRIGMKRRRNSIEVEKGMAFGMIGMNMRSGIADMDVE
ncbi:Glutamine amidotransferase type-2 domain-containing protein [Mycena venus]|uniref:Glutamine amidotransferase type-2 domain-containing protein n=1 Tax=Mycena venus TaxID=2733690 RepID=A0A8H7CIC9_9AGAR|nr:Glutamine amidotransferase type-2 domain-containing protein [Mycena venus]